MKIRFIVGGIIMALGITLIPFLSIYSFFVSIPIIITGICIFASGMFPFSPRKIAIGTSSILGVYYLGMYLLLVSMQALI